jgi:hypothetical protein
MGALQIVKAYTERVETPIGASVAGLVVLQPDLTPADCACGKHINKILQQIYMCACF